jgi:hypothetical protein
MSYTIQLRDASVDTMSGDWFEIIERLLNDRKPIYVRNNTAKPMSILSMPYPTREGQKSFGIPRTSIPFNLAALISHDNLRDCSAFRTLLAKGLLALVPEDEAKVELSSDPNLNVALRNALDEANNTAQSRASEAQLERSSGSSSNSESPEQTAAVAALAVIDPKMAAAARRMNPNSVPRMQLDARVNTRLNALEARARSGSASEQAIMSELSLMLSELTDEELKRISLDAAWPVNAQEWSKQRLIGRQKLVDTKKRAASQDKSKSL